MKPSKRKEERLPCAQIHPDDCIDPRDFFRTKTRRRDDRKDRQLCKQVYRTLCTLLAGGFADPVIQDLMVESVEPAPDASRLLVTVRPTTLADRVAPATVHQHLCRVATVLRIEVAAAICRRKAPELIYRVAGPEEVRP